MQSLNGCVPASECRANTAEARAYEMVSKVHQLSTVFERLRRIFRGSCACFAGLVDADWILVRSVISAALSDSEITVSEAIRYVYYSFPIEASPEAPDSTVAGSSDQAQIFSLYDLFIC